MRPVLPPGQRSRRAALRRVLGNPGSGDPGVPRAVARNRLRAGCRIDGPSVAVGTAVVGPRPLPRPSRTAGGFWRRCRHTRRIRLSGQIRRQGDRRSRFQQPPGPRNGRGTAEGDTRDRQPDRPVFGAQARGRRTAPLSRRDGCLGGPDATHRPRQPPLRRRQRRGVPGAGLQPGGAADHGSARHFFDFSRGPRSTLRTNDRRRAERADGKGPIPPQGRLAASRRGVSARRTHRGRARHCFHRAGHQRAPRLRGDAEPVPRRHGQLGGHDRADRPRLNALRRRQRDFLQDARVFPRRIARDGPARCPSNQPGGPRARL